MSKFKIIVLDDNNNIYNASTIESNDDDINKKVTDNLDSFFKSFDKEYIINNITNDLSKSLKQKSPYFGYHRSFFSPYIINTSNNTNNQNNDIEDTENIPDTETGLSNLLGAMSRLESENYTSPFPSVSNEDWTKFIKSEFLIEDENSGENDINVEDDNENVDEALAIGSHKSFGISHNSIFERTMKKEIKDLKNQIDNIKSSYDMNEKLNTKINKDIETIKTDLNILFEKILPIVNLIKY